MILKDWKFYNQWNFYKGYYTHGQGISYNYKNTIVGRLGYYNDIEHELNYSSLGLSFIYDRYDIGVGYIIGGDIFPANRHFIPVIVLLAFAILDGIDLFIIAKLFEF